MQSTSPACKWMQVLGHVTPDCELLEVMEVHAESALELRDYLKQVQGVLTCSAPLMCMLTLRRRHC